MDMNTDLYLEHLNYLSSQGKYPEEIKNWVLPLKKKENYLEKVLKAKGLWQDKK